MTILEAEKECRRLQEEISCINEKYYGGDGTLVRIMKEKEIKPLYDEWNRLMLLIDKAKKETKI